MMEAQTRIENELAKHKEDETGSIAPRDDDAQANLQNPLHSMEIGKDEHRVQIPQNERWQSQTKSIVLPD